MIFYLIAVDSGDSLKVNISGCNKKTEAIQRTVNTIVAKNCKIL